jgi:hypothetical protein
MEDTQILSLWKSYGAQLQESLTLNRKNAQDITRLKVQSLLASMKPWKIFAILTGILWVGFVDMLLIGLFNIAHPMFLVSAGLHVILTKLAIGIYVYQYILLQQVNITEPILQAQERIARLQSSTILVARLLFLQLPAWTTFYWDQSMLEGGNAGWFILQAVVTLSFTLLAIWLFFNIKFENRNKKWFRLIFTGGEWDPVIKSMEMLQQVDEHKAANKQ